MAVPWVEEATLLAPPSLRRKGNLYIIASGVPRETELVIKALRDQYYGEVGEATDAAQELREALETANALLQGHRAIGVSCQAATVLEGQRLFIAGAGDGAAYLFSSRDGSIELLNEPTAMAPLGSQTVAALGQTQRRLMEGDVLLLVSAAAAEALEEREIAALASLAQGEGPQACADRLVERASQESPEGSAAAIAVACAAASPPVPTIERRPRPVSEEEMAPQALVGHAPPSGGPRLSRFWLGLAALAALALVVFGATQLYPLVMPVAATPTTTIPQAATSTPSGIVATATPYVALPSPAATEPALTPQPEGVWQRIDELWREGEKGGEDSPAAWREAISLLEQLQATTANDPLIEEKLSVAQLNLAYRAGMQKTDTYWCDGTSASTVLSWNVVVETLEDLYGLPLSASWMNNVKIKLYSAHMNCGKALEALGRSYEAEGHYGRARQIR